MLLKEVSITDKKFPNKTNYILYLPSIYDDITIYWCKFEKY